MDVWRYEISLQVLEKTFNKWVQQMSEIFFMSEQSIFLKAGMLSCLLYKHQWNIPFHYNILSRFFRDHSEKDKIIIIALSE